MLKYCFKTSFQIASEIAIKGTQNGTINLLRKNVEENLREAACFGNLDLLKELILNGVDVNSRNHVNGWTALHWAAYRNNVEAVSTLLNNGADKNISTHKDELASDLTSSETIQIILGGKVGARKEPSLPFVPNYIRNPSLHCSQMNSRPCQKESKHCTPDEGMMLRVRVADVLDTDFIEVELSKSELSIQRLKEICCTELGVEPHTVLKIRKLPNTIIRNDKDVQRLQAFQEVEVVKS